MNRSAAITRSLLGWGVVAGPFYLVVGIAQGLLREGFDFSGHALSHLANGPWGWIQTANFVFSGVMVIAAAIGVARALDAKHVIPWFLAAYGSGLILAAVFPADPVVGFPPGTPQGASNSISTTGLIHFVVAVLGLVALMISCFAAFVTFKRRGESSISRLSLASGIVITLGFFGGPALGNAGIVGIWIAVATGWAWLAILSLHLYRVSPHPDG